MNSQMAILVAAGILGVLKNYVFPEWDWTGFWLAGLGMLIFGTFQNVSALSRDIEAIKEHLDKVLPLPDEDD
jgi:hypothetical protein